MNSLAPMNTIKKNEKTSPLTSTQGKYFKFPSPFQHREDNVQNSMQKNSTIKVIKRRSFTPCRTMNSIIFSPEVSPIELNDSANQSDQFNSMNDSNDQNQSTLSFSMDSIATIPLLPPPRKNKSKKENSLDEKDLSKNTYFTPSPNSPNSSLNTTVNTSNSFEMYSTPRAILNRRVCIGSILMSANLTQYSKLFKNIDFNTFITFTENDLLQIGISDKTDRSLLIKCIKEEF